MNLLFIHGGFPAQFQHIAPHLAANLAAKTIFLTKSENDQGIHLKNVEIVRFSKSRDSSSSIHHYLQPAENAVLEGQAALKAIHRLCSEGFVPDVIILHGGMGYGLYIKNLVPKVKIIVYSEWFFREENAKYLYGSDDLDINLATKTRNWSITQELLEADAVVIPTSWQKKQFPEIFWHKVQVIFDGIDTEMFFPAPVNREVDFSLPVEFQDHSICVPGGAKILAYATRGMEPLRGFPEFMKMTASLQQMIPNLHTIIAGRDRIAYSYAPSGPTQSWKDLLLKQLTNDLDLTRLHFVGLLTYGDLIRLYRRADLYCYFTRPYVTSWSLFQAAASGATILVNKTPAIEGVFASNSDVNYVDLDNHKNLSETAYKALLNGQLSNHVSLLDSNLSLSCILPKWTKLVKDLFLGDVLDN